MQYVSHIIKKNRCITTDELQPAKSLCCATIYAIIHKHSIMKKVCAYWVPRDLKPQQKERRIQNCQELLALHSRDPEGFFVRAVTGDKFWFHYQSPNLTSNQFSGNYGQKLMQEIRWPQYSGTWRVSCQRSGFPNGKQQ